MDRDNKRAFLNDVFTEDELERTYTNMGKNKVMLAINRKGSKFPVKDIIPTYKNRELQDFITTSTRWKIKYPFRHKENCLIVEELMANLFVIFTLGGEDLDFIKQNYSEIYQEYKKYYDFITGQKVVTNE
ncbi:MAG: hypothetical protein ACRC1M_02935 [Methanobacteriaceae archaeon]